MTIDSLNPCTWLIQIKIANKNKNFNITITAYYTKPLTNILSSWLKTVGLNKAEQCTQFIQVVLHGSTRQQDTMFYLELSQHTTYVTNKFSKYLQYLHAIASLNYNCTPKYKKQLAICTSNIAQYLLNSLVQLRLWILQPMSFIHDKNRPGYFP